jgi:hypothetical protein
MPAYKTLTCAGRVRQWLGTVQAAMVGPRVIASRSGYDATGLDRVAVHPCAERAIGHIEKGTSLAAQSFVKPTPAAISLAYGSPNA